MKWETLGLPNDNVNVWFTNDIHNGPIAPPEKLVKVRKNIEIPILECYRSLPSKEFWDIFPNIALPKEGQPLTQINVPLFQALVKSIQYKMSPEEIILAELVINNLYYGADSYVDESLLPGVEVANSPCMVKPEIAPIFTDQLVTFMKEGFIAGPFSHKPYPDFRCNSLFAVSQG